MKRNENENEKRKKIEGVERERGDGEQPVLAMLSFCSPGGFSRKFLFSGDPTWFASIFWFRIVDI